MDRLGRQTLSTQNVETFVARISSGEFSEENELALWPGSDPAREKELQMALDDWHDIGLLSKQANESMQRETLSDGKKRSGVAVKGAHALLMVAASFVLVLTFGFFLPEDLNWQQSDQKTLVEYQTQIGEQREVTLQDGSTIFLNTASRVFVDFDRSTRRAILYEGEAFFEVSKDENRPFVVEVGERSITVLGTKFNVYKRSGEAFDLAVLEGKVAVHSPDEVLANPLTVDLQKKQKAGNYLLKAGSFLRFKEGNTDLSTLDPIDSDVFGGWRTRAIRFLGVELVDVVTEVGRYTDTDIVIADPEIAEMQVNAILQLDNWEGVFEGLELAFPIKVTREKG